MLEILFSIAQISYIRQPKCVTPSEAYFRQMGFGFEETELVLSWNSDNEVYANIDRFYIKISTTKDVIKNSYVLRLYEFRFSFLFY